MEIGIILSVLSNLLRAFADKIDAGNSNLNETEALELVDLVKHFTDREELITKYEACKYLNISRATFDNYVRAGKLPKGKKKIGSTAEFYTKKELDECVKELRMAKRRGKQYTYNSL